MNTQVRTRSRASAPAQGSRAAGTAQRSDIQRSGAQRSGAPGRGAPGSGARSLRPADPGQAGERQRRSADQRDAALAGQRAVRLAGQRDAPGRTLPVARTPFILLVLGLLGGGLVCLLVINTTLAAGTFQINNLQRQNVTLTLQEQSLQEQVASEQSPARIEQEARALGMRQQQVLRFINAQTGRIYTMPSTVKGVAEVPAGYVP